MVSPVCQVKTAKRKKKKTLFRLDFSSPVGYSYTMKNNTNPNPINDYMDDSDPDMDAYLVGLEAQCVAGVCDPGCPICHDDHNYWNAAEDYAEAEMLAKIAEMEAEGYDFGEDDPDDMLDRYWSGF